MERICEICGRTEEDEEEILDHDLHDVCNVCTGDLKAHATAWSET